MFKALRNAPVPQMEQRAIQVTPWGDWTGTSFQSAAGEQVTEDSALQLSTVYGCVTLISDTIATLPRDVFRKLSDGTNQEVPNKPGWFEQPGPNVDIIEFITQSLSSLLLDGNCYWAYSVDRNFAPTSLRVLDPTKVQVKPVNQNGLELSSMDPAGQVEFWVEGGLYKGRILHIKGLTRPGMLKGLSPVECARQAIGISLAADEFAGNFYKNGTIMSAVVEVPGPMTVEEAKKLKDGISRDHGGVANSHLPGVITNGAKWQQIGITPEQAQFLESRNFQRGQIAAEMFLLDPSLLGIASAGTRGANLTYANLEQRGIHLVQFTLLRWIIRLERAFSFLLPRPQFMKFNVSSLERADLLTRYQAHRIALGPTQPWEAVNEVRAIEDEPPQPGFDKIAEPPAEPVLPAPFDAPAGTPNASPFAKTDSPAPNGKSPVGANK